MEPRESPSQRWDGGFSVDEIGAKVTLITDNSLGMVLLRTWLWLVPIGMLIASIGFGAYAVSDGRWPLFGFMVVIAFVAIVMLIFHWWVLYRFGKYPVAEGLQPSKRNPE